MSYSRPLLIAALALVAALPALAQQDGGTPTVSYNPCIDETGKDKQPPFTADAGYPTAVILTPDNKLRLNTNRSILDPERIILPFDQELEALLVHDQAGGGASNTLGWFYYDDLIAAGYIDPKDEDNPNDDVLLDKNGNGVPDFHEHLYNLDPQTYIGDGPRCGNQAKTFQHKRADGITVTLREPDLLTGPCNVASTYSSTAGPRRWRDSYGTKPSGGVVGARVMDHPAGVLNNANDMQTNPTNVDSYFSDRGLFPHIPNLLEPRSQENGNRGIGHFVFLATDDDDNHCPSGNIAGDSPTSECFQPRMAYREVNGVRSAVGPVWDSRLATGQDGLPDYKASAFDDRGVLIPGRNPLEAPNEEDRRKKMGVIQGQREIVFFLVTYVEQIYDGTDTCFITKMTTWPANQGGGPRLQCDLWAHGDINVFFTKTLLNLDLHQTKDDIVTVKELRNGWLDGVAYDRLRSPTYGQVRFNTNQNQEVKSYFRRAAHTLVGAPVDNPRVWILGWEDQNSGGNRTYDDTVILINKQNNGIYKSDLVSSIPLDVAQDYTITSVEMTIDDQPYYRFNNQTSDCQPPAPNPIPDGYVQPKPQITYQVSLDCKVCVDRCATSNPDFQPNPNPHWVTMPFPDATATPGTRVNITRTVNDFLEQGFTGSQLCWRAVFESPGESCQPTIANVNISYKAQKAGQYGRAASLGVANTVILGVSETPGRTWYTPAPWYEQSSGNPLYPSKRVYDQRLDVAERGHVYLRRLYEPDRPNRANTEADDWNQWDGGEQLNRLIRTASPNDRQLFTSIPTTTPTSRVTVASQAIADDNSSPLFPTVANTNDEARNFCATTLGRRYDLNQDGLCDKLDRTALRNWLYGWEDNSLATGPVTRRTWPMGGINLSTAAIVGPASEPTWVKRASLSEQAAFRSNTFIGNTVMKTRGAAAFIGSTSGFLHALSLGELRSGDDSCTSFRDFRGYFAHNSGCSTGREYGTGGELYAYVPGKLLRFFAENYVRGNDKTKRASVDASPAVTVVDLRSGSEYLPDTGYNPATGTQWRLSTQPNERTDAKTVLVSPTGPQQSVFFALDVTRPTETGAGYPGVLWEFDPQRERINNSGDPCAGTTNGCKPLEEQFAQRPDTTGSRHNPLLVRMDFGTRGGKKWVAAFASDYSPRNTGGRATLYLIDVKTGLPIQVAHAGQTPIRRKLAGVVVMGDEGEGVGGAPVAIDVDGDSNYDVVYVPTTKARVFRVNLRDVDASRAPGLAVPTCVIADARTDKDPATNRVIDDAARQGLYSQIAVSQERSGSGTSVRIYMGTGNNPDLDNEDVDRDPRPRYHVMAFVDSNPLASGCVGRSVAWVQKLGPRQVVWGGVSVDEEGVVHTATAVGTSANQCSLDADESGRVYAFNGSNGAPQPTNDASLEGHSLTQPLIFDKKVVIQTNNGFKLVNNGSDVFNNETGTGLGSTARTLIWDVKTTGNIQGVVP
ncbi:pilus assembly protein PilY [Myxococcus sp. K38C18041901]|uniref:pilus assembly protein PilY n=1 Tax=Myxococcus guangdongensis TaxID=2906760 RepID=UPI0020A7095A|nr:pilus assembly protein PilY [Myxococcus guangdongensis]MCP3058574.1 pilus assembly protein PilY [Myxococcus guangdongensis]